MTNNEPRDVQFETFVRDNPDVKKLATTWRGSAEYFAWMETMLSEGNQTIEYLEGEQVTTFYRYLDDAEKRAREKEQTVVTEEKQAPAHFEILSVPHEHSDENATHRVTHIRLSRPRWEPVGERFAHVEYVHVDQFSTRVEDEAGSFVYSTTRVLITDEEGNDYSKEGAESIYQAPGFLDVWQAMYALGELPVQEQETDA